MSTLVNNTTIFNNNNINPGVNPPPNSSNTSLNNNSTLVNNMTQSTNNESTIYGGNSKNNLQTNSQLSISNIESGKNINVGAMTREKLDLIGSQPSMNILNTTNNANFTNLNMTKSVSMPLASSNLNMGQLFGNHIGQATNTIPTGIVHPIQMNNNYNVPGNYLNSISNTNLLNDKNNTSLNSMTLTTIPNNNSYMQDTSLIIEEKGEILKSLKASNNNQGIPVLVIDNDQDIQKLQQNNNQTNNPISNRFIGTKQINFIFLRERKSENKISFIYFLKELFF